MLVTIEGYILALAKIKGLVDNKIIRTYVKYSCNYDRNKEEFDKDINDITLDDIYALDEYDIASVSGKFVYGENEIEKIIKIFDWSLDVA